MSNAIIMHVFFTETEQFRENLLIYQTLNGFHAFFLHTKTRIQVNLMFNMLKNVFKLFRIF